VKNHPFVDGNKRIGFATAVLFLELNGVRFEASEDVTISLSFSGARPTARVTLRKGSGTKPRSVANP
jgi:death-on-curing family protein